MNATFGRTRTGTALLRYGLLALICGWLVWSLALPLCIDSLTRRRSERKCERSGASRPVSRDLLQHVVSSALMTVEIRESVTGELAFFRLQENGSLHTGAVFDLLAKWIARIFTNVW